MSTDPIAPISDGIDDDLLTYGRNGHAPVGALQALIARHVRYRQHQGRPLGHFWGGWDRLALTTGATTFRMARFDMLDGGCANFATLMHVVPKASEFSTTAGIYIGGVRVQTAGGISAATDYPEPISNQGNGSTPLRSPAVATGGTIEQVVGFDSVYPMSGCFYEDAVTGVSDTSTTVLATTFGPAKDIVATQTGSYGTVARLVDRFMHVWRNRRTVFTWFTQEDSYVEMAQASHEYRCIFDQSVGGTGTPPGATGPAITMPLLAQAPANEQSVRVYVWVYAAMSGTTDGGTLAIANKASSFATVPLVNGATIGGTGYAWYPSLGAFDPTTAPYFLASTAADFERICLMARSEGTTDKTRVRGFMMAVFPAR